MATNSINDKRANSYIPVLLFAFAALVWRTQYYVASLYVAIPLLIVYCFGFIRTLFSNQYTGIFPSPKKSPLTYRKFGEYKIDNLVAERTIWNMTIQRKNSLFFCSDKGARNSAIYNIFISTFRQVGVSFRDYFRKLMKELGTDRTDYENLLPMTIGGIKMSK